MPGIDSCVNGIDGLDFNERGGGKNSYPPNTRYLKQFQKDEPLYPESLFKKKNSGVMTDESLSELVKAATFTCINSFGKS
jgi:hypothetical protein